MGFFDNIEVTGNFDMGGGDFEPIPNNTQLKAIIEEAKWDEYEGNKYISIRWSVLGGEYNNRKIFQKLKVGDADPKKHAKALTMLGAIDTNAGGKLVAENLEPTDFALTSCLCNKAMMIQLAVWKIDGKEGNWVKSVSGSGKAATPAAPKAPNIDEDIPF